MAAVFEREGRERGSGEYRYLELGAFSSYLST